MTIEKASLHWKPGPRLTQASLSLNVRTSQGGKLPIQLPNDSTVTRVEINGQSRPMAASAGQLDLPLSPGSQTMMVSWQQPWTLGQSLGLPEVTVLNPAVNVEVKLDIPQGRWIAWVGRTDVSPSLQLGVRLLVLLGLALAAMRFLPGPNWLWLGLGMHQLSWPAFAVILCWWALVLKGPLPRIPDLLWRAVVGAGLLLSMGLLLGAAHAGLLGNPDLLIEGPGSGRYSLQWFEGRTEAMLPAPVVIAPPLWLWRLGMLIWTLGILARLPAWSAPLRAKLGT
jgi:hypothetical protein